MKVRIETEKAARIYSCAVGDYRGLEGRDALPLIDSGDVSTVNEDGAAPVEKPARSHKATKKSI